MYLREEAPRLKKEDFAVIKSVDRNMACIRKTCEEAGSTPEDGQPGAEARWRAGDGARGEDE